MRTASLLVVLTLVPATLCWHARTQRHGRCVDVQPVRPAYLSHDPVASTNRTVNILILDTHPGMEAELLNVVHVYAASRPHLTVRTLAVSVSERMCETQGIDVYGMCLADDQAKLARLAPTLDWLHNADVVLFSMPPALLQLLLPLNKALVLWLAVPPEYGRQNDGLYRTWLADFRHAVQQRHVVVLAASEYDRMYVNYFYGADIETVSLPSDHLAPPRRAPDPTTRLQLGLFPKATWAQPWVAHELEPALQALRADCDVDMVDPSANRGAVSDLHRFDAVVYMPYMRNTNLFMEAYRSNIPIFTPSLDYLVRLDQAHCMLANRVYWTRTPPPCSPPYPHNPATLEYGAYPGVLAPASHTFWINKSEQFSPHMPGVVYFDGATDLVAKVQATDLAAVRATMARQNQLTRSHIHERWGDVLDRIIAAAPCSDGQGAVCETGRLPFGLTREKCSDNDLAALHQAYAPGRRARSCGVKIHFDEWPKRLSCGTWDEEAFG